MIYLDTPYAILSWDEIDAWVTLEFRGYVEGAVYRALLDKQIEVLVARSATKLLCDMRRMTVLTAADQAWVDSTWTPKLVKSVRHLDSALVMPKSAVAQLSLDRIVRKQPPTKLGESLLFDDIDKAKAWLRSLP
jgi:hypothetical protein